MSEDFSPPAVEPGPKHYYGDVVRILFVVAAVLILLAQVVGIAFLTTQAALVAAVVLILSAGLTNPVQIWIHFINVLLSAGGLLISAGVTLDRFKTSPNFLTEGWIVMVLTIVFICALYSATKTLRGSLMRGAPLIK